MWVLSSDRGVGRLIDQGFVSVVAEGTGVVVPPHGVARGEGAERERQRNLERTGGVVQGRGEPGVRRRSGSLSRGAGDGVGAPRFELVGSRHQNSRSTGSRAGGPFLPHAPCRESSLQGAMWVAVWK